MIFDEFSPHHHQSCLGNIINILSVAAKTQKVWCIVQIWKDGTQDVKPNYEKWEIFAYPDSDGISTPRDRFPRSKKHAGALFQQFQDRGAGGPGGGRPGTRRRLLVAISLLMNPRNEIKGGQKSLFLMFFVSPPYRSTGGLMVASARRAASAWPRHPCLETVET